MILCSFINYRKKYSKEFGNTSKFKFKFPGIALIVTHSFTGTELYFSDEHILKKHNAENNISDHLPP